MCGGVILRVCGQSGPSAKQNARGLLERFRVVVKLDQQPAQDLDFLLGEAGQRDLLVVLRQRRNLARERGALGGERERDRTSIAFAFCATNKSLLHETVDDPRERGHIDGSVHDELGERLPWFVAKRSADAPFTEAEPIGLERIGKRITHSRAGARHEIGDGLFEVVVDLDRAGVGGGFHG